MAEQDVESDYPDRGGPVEEPAAERGKKEAPAERDRRDRGKDGEEEGGETR